MIVYTEVLDRQPHGVFGGCDLEWLSDADLEALAERIKELRARIDMARHGGSCNKYTRAYMRLEKAEGQVRSAIHERWYLRNRPRPTEEELAGNINFRLRIR